MLQPKRIWTWWVSPDFSCQNQLKILEMSSEITSIFPWLSSEITQRCLTRVITSPAEPTWSVTQSSFTSVTQMHLVGSGYSEIFLNVCEENERWFLSLKEHWVYEQGESRLVSCWKGKRFGRKIGGPEVKDEPTQRHTLCGRSVYDLRGSPIRRQSEVEALSRWYQCS